MPLLRERETRSRPIDARTSRPISHASQLFLIDAAKLVPVLDVDGWFVVVVVVEVPGAAVTGCCGCACAICSGVGEELVEDKGVS